ncbi:uncharacterized protein BCR38DRAFT_50496 [Pseudomassariella vexata]|uniref:GATA-type domain-containing protein n=1 Tax=Pseudomassariella vexata TaxID=1141098 RepID=A0A1Y2DPA7_9PEZI|nr:uncharacterized protein BCR38DRAFT_50496 [Pseudomassariella vexata]ORY61009.1 hypothetical protein BCR38DRAFT_50496 [Pseudomassariella vexata]
MNSLPIRLAPPQETKAESSSTVQPVTEDAVARIGPDGDLGSHGNHQFWLKEIKIAESLYTIHGSAKHLLDFTGNMLGCDDKAAPRRPIAMMSDSDVAFMSQLTNEIARSVGGISAARAYGVRSNKRKSKRLENREMIQQWTSAHSSSSKRIHLSKEESSCHKCGRTDTPEWRKGPEGPGTLCNVCGLLYAKTKQKGKAHH